MSTHRAYFENAKRKQLGGQQSNAIKGNILGNRFEIVDAGGSESTHNLAGENNRGSGENDRTRQTMENLYSHTILMGGNVNDLATELSSVREGRN